MKLKRRLFALDLTLKWARSSEIPSRTEFGESTKMLRDGGLWSEWESGERQLIQERDKGPGVLLTLWIAYLAHMKPSGGGGIPSTAQKPTYAYHFQRSGAEGKEI